MKTLALALALWLIALPTGAAPLPYLRESADFVAAVAAGTLPPIAARLPQAPAVVDLRTNGLTPGVQGGDLHLLMGKPKDTRMMTVYGYARLVGYDQNYKLVPDLVESFDNDRDRVFTLHLRPGHRWSDGAPFTSEDFRYYWEDVANNSDLSPVGPASILLVDGEAPTVTFPDATTVRYAWSRPNPYFLPALAAAQPLYIYRPAHYLKQFHAHYADPAKLKAMVAAASARTWAGLHNRLDNQYRFDNPDLPTLQPWKNTTASPSRHYIFVRNPYYHRIDTNGVQLPYISRVIIDIVSASLIPVKTGAGDSDLQARYLRLDDYTFLKAGEQRNHYQVRLWHSGRGSQIALYPNLNSRDPVWRGLARDVRFRRALSLGINRHEINQVVYFGLVLEGNNTVLPSCPLFKPQYQREWATYDPATANALLDRIGLSRRDPHGIRLRPDGKPLDITVQSVGKSTEESDVLQLISDSWLKLGIKLYIKPTQLEVFRNRAFSGDAMMSVWWGMDNALPTADMAPDEFTPTTQDQLQWPKWGQYFDTNGHAGAPPDLSTARQLLRLNRQWRRAGSHAQRAKAWHRILALNASQVFSIGTVCGVPQPVVIRDSLRNIPVKGTYSWAPGAYFGIYHPDVFWFDPAYQPGAH